MKISFHPDAASEFEDAVSYYEECQAGLGLEFAEEVYSTITRIAEFPDAWSTMSANTRRCVTLRFPYGVIYRLITDTVHIIAIANLHRRPNYWKTRDK